MRLSATNACRSGGSGRNTTEYRSSLMPVNTAKIFLPALKAKIHQVGVVVAVRPRVRHDDKPREDDPLSLVRIGPVAPMVLGRLRGTVPAWCSRSTGIRE